MVQGVGKEEHFHRRCPITKSEEAQKRLLIFKEDIYASAEDIAPDGDEDPSMYAHAAGSSQYLLTTQVSANYLRTQPIWWMFHESTSPRGGAQVGSTTGISQPLFPLRWIRQT